MFGSYNISFVIAPDNSGRVEVIDPGLPNMNAGPDFFNAKLKIDGTLWWATSKCIRRHQTGCSIGTTVTRRMIPSSCTWWANRIVMCTARTVSWSQMVLTCPDTVRLRYEELRQTEIYPPLLFHPCLPPKADRPFLAVRFAGRAF